MALLVINIQKAVSEVLAGIHEGVEDVGSIVSNVTANPPEKVTFEIDAITALNFFERKRIVDIPEKKTTTTVDEVTARDEFYLNGVLAEVVDYVDSSEFTVERIEASGGSERTEYEDNAIGVVLEIPGPKSS